jgi:hypothetical protein
MPRPAPTFSAVVEVGTALVLMIDPAIVVTLLIGRQEDEHTDRTLYE